jgi:hypothetical protein
VRRVYEKFRNILKVQEDEKIYFMKLKRVSLTNRSFIRKVGMARAKAK